MRFEQASQSACLCLTPADSSAQMKRLAGTKGCSPCPEKAFPVARRASKTQKVRAGRTGPEHEAAPPVGEPNRRPSRRMANLQGLSRRRLAGRCNLELGPEPSYIRAVDAQGPMRIVGRRRPSSGGLEAANGFLHLVIALRGNRPFIPRGVHRFGSYEEKDAWTLRMLTRPSPARPR